jgi:glycosyltransferase involved in cell wall biosynthesis
VKPVVLMVSGEYPPTLGGIGDYTRILSNGLCLHGVDVRLFVPSGSAVEGTASPVAGTFPKWSWKTLSSLYDTLVGTRASWLHVQHNASMYGSSLACYYFPRYLRWRGWKGRVAVTFHDINPPTLLPRGSRMWAGMAHRWVIGDLARQADVSIAADPSDAESLAALGARVAQVPIGSNMHIGGETHRRDTAIRAQYGVSPASTLVGHFGTPVGLETMLEALQSLPNVTLLLIGKQRDMRNRSNIEKLTSRVHDAIVKFAVGERLRWTGHLSEADVVAAMDACDMIVLPYQSGASMRHGGLMAALTQGKAVITTSPRKAMLGLVDGVSHAEVPAGDAKRLETTIRCLAADASQRRCFEDGARRAAAEFYSWAAIVARHEAIYEEQCGVTGVPSLALRSVRTAS